MKIEEIQAGPEIDALVATEVMRWTRPPKSVFWYMDSGESGIAHIAGRAMVAETAIGAGCADLFQPSVRIDHAWKVIEKISRKTWRNMELDVLVYQFKDHAQCVIEADMEDVKSIGLADIDAPTAPLAICRAALLAMS